MGEIWLQRKPRNSGLASVALSHILRHPAKQNYSNLFCMLVIRAQLRVLHYQDSDAHDFGAGQGYGKSKNCRPAIRASEN